MKSAALRITACLASILFLGGVAKADFDYNGNGLFGTLKINDHGLDSNPLYSVFNMHFGTDYKSSNALYTDFGVATGSQVFVGPNATIQAIYKDAKLSHDFVLDNGLGDVHTFSYESGKFENPGSPQSIAPPGLYNLAMKTYNGDILDGTYFLDPGLNKDKMIHMLVFDVSEFFLDQSGNIIKTLLIALEDLPFGNAYADWDYNDGMYLVQYVDYTPVTTPEPATLLIFAVGLAVVPFARRKKNVR